MIYGHFFKLDRDSLLSNGQVIFRYLPIRSKSDNGKDEYPYYPVYAALGRYAIDFYYHAKDSENDRHVHIRLLHLPLSLNLNVKDNLTSILQNDVYNGKYEISPKYETDLVGHNDIKTYWNLQIFRSKNIEKNEIYKEYYYKNGNTNTTSQETKNNSNHFIFYRKLLLDFIYDLEHTHVFENSPYYEEAEVRLRENFLFNAIAAKAAYYWDRHNWTQSKNKELQNHPENEKNSKDAVSGIIYSENLATSEKQWLKILRSEQSCEYCSYSRGWFQRVEKEYKDVIFPKSKNKQVQKTFNRYEWRQTLIQGSNNNNIYEKENLNITRESVRWFLRRYNFISAVHLLWNFRKCKPPSVILICLQLLGLGGLIYILLINDTNYILIRQCIYILLWISFLLFLMLVIFIRKNSELPILGIFMPRLIMAISSAWILFTTTEEIYKSSFDVTCSAAWWVVALIIPVMLFMMLETQNIASDVHSWGIIGRCCVVLGIGFIYSLLIGMFFINFTANRILPRSGYLPTFYYELNKDEDKDKKAIQWENPYEGDSLQKLKATLSTKLYSDLKEVHPKSNEVCPILSECPVLLEIEMKILKTFCFHLDVLPRMLFSKAIFALFIGIFIQLIFEDKPITEPL